MNKYHYLFFALAILFLSQTTQAQVIKDWDFRYGGSSADNLIGYVPVPVGSWGAYFLAGYSNSPASGDKIASIFGNNDFWVVRTDVNGGYLIDYSFGGLEDDYLTSTYLSSNGTDFLLGGYSNSDDNGNKSASRIGTTNATNDFWLVKVMDSGTSLIKQWDRTYGSTVNDELYAVIEEPTGNYVLVGSTDGSNNTDVSGTSNGGSDFWIVVVDPSTGSKLSDYLYGGDSDDVPYAIIPTSDGGFLVGGKSKSNASGNKSQANQGSNTDDFWVLKLDGSYGIQWERTFGGSNTDILRALYEDKNGDFFLTGWSNSGVSGTKTSASNGSYDFWVVKIDASGNQIWDKSFGGSGWDYGYTLIPTSDGNFLVGGKSNSGMSGDKSEDSQGGSDQWIIAIDENGNKLWDKTFGGDDTDDLQQLVEIDANKFLLLGSSESSASGDKSQPNQGSAGTGDFWMVQSIIDSTIVDSLALIAIYDSMGGTGWTAQTNWKTSNPISTWHGVSINANGRVDSLSLEANNLSNTIPNDINNLTYLQYLQFGSNNITGAIPNLSLPELTYLSLFSNSISGSLQDYNLPQLKIMSISSNNLSGAIPNFSYLNNIEQIYLFSNQFTSIPDLALPNLTLLRVSNNQLVGNIPDFLGLTALVNLNLSDNQLTGSIPSSFNSLTNLQYIQLYGNNLSGAIPDLSALLLVTFRVEENNLSGITAFNYSIPSTWGNTASNSGLQLQENQFTFEDLEPYVPSIPSASVSYVPQDSVGTDTTYNMQIGESLTIDLGIDGVVSSNVYYWYKDGTLIDSVYGFSQYTISNISLSNAGIYTCQVKNFIVTDLTLYSRPVTLSVANPLIVTTTAETGAGSLTEAIVFANNNAGPDTITFNIAGTAPFEISLNMNGLPSLSSDSTIINGISQPGYSEGDIRINGNNNFVNGLEVYGNYCELYGLYIYHFTGAGVSISNANNIKIGANSGRNFFAGNTDGILVDNGNQIDLKYNFSGTNASETTGIGNLNGIAVKNSQNITIENNVCSANNGEGIVIENVDGANIKNNKVGVKQDGTTTFANLNGIVVKSASSNVIIEMNTIAFNTNYGIDIQDNSTTQISQNSIYCNTNTPILLGMSANSNTSTPTINTANTNTISGTATANSSIELFMNDNSTCGGTQPCQGRTYLTTVSTDNWGNWSYNNVFTTGTQITVTETIGTETSGFANCMTVAALCSVDLGNDTTICANEPLLLDAGNAGATYSWSDGSSNQTLSINPMTTTRYFVTVTDAAGCTAIDSINVTVNSLPTINITGNTAICVGTTHTYNGNPIGGSGNYVVHDWQILTGTGTVNILDNKDGTADITALTAGTVTIEYRATDDNGCTGSNTYTFTINDNPTANITGSDMCASNAITFNGNPMGGSGTYTSHNWQFLTGSGMVTINNNNDGTAEITGNTAGTVTIEYQVTDNNGCMGSNTYTFTVYDSPTINITGAIGFCENETSTYSGNPMGGTGSYTHIWNLLNGTATLTNNNDGTVTISNATVGSLDLEYIVTDGNSCSSKDTLADITVLALPILTMGNDTSVTTSSPAFNLTASPTGGTWSGTGVTGSMFDPSLTGTGIFYARYNYNDGNCSNTDSIQIIVGNVPCATNITGNNMCVGNSEIFNGNPTGGSGTYTAHDWQFLTGTGTVTINNNNDGTANITGNTAGIVTIQYKATDNSGCSDSTTYTLTVYDNPTVNITGSDICVGNSISFNGNPMGGSGNYTTHNWQFLTGTGTITINNNNDGTADITGNTVGTVTIEYQVTDDNGCMGSNTYTFTVNDNPTANITGSDMCLNESVLFNGNPMGGSGTYTTHNWQFLTGSGMVTIINNNDGTAEITGNTAGTVTIEYQVTDNNGCIGSNTYTFNVNDNPTPNITGAIGFCENETSIYSGNPMGGTGSYTHIWNLLNGTATLINNNDETVTISNATVGSLDLEYIVTDGNSCSSKDTLANITVSALPILTMGNDTTVTTSSPSFNLAASPTGGTWSGIGVNASGVFDPAAAGEGSFYAYYNYNDGNCANIDSILITVGAITCTTTDSVALVNLYNTTNGMGWTNNTNWLSPNPIATWYGVSVNPTTGCVDSLDLANNNLVGTLSDFDLSNIVTLNLDSNQITGTIPNFMNMPNLQLLALGYNNLNGTIPNFGFLTNLQILRLDNNSLSGTIPNLSLGSLKTIILNNNNLDIIQLMPNLGSVEYLNVSNNALNGTIPNFDNSTLQYLFLDNNQFTGTAPDLAACTNLKELALQRNQLSTIPNFNLPNLERLLIGYNQLSDLPVFTNLTNLQVWDAANNQLTFEDINPNIAIASVDFVYNPQDSVGTTQTATITSSTDYTISHLNIDNSISTNTYYWYLDGVLIDSTNFNQYTITNISAANAGTYHAQVVNPTAPNLRLYSRGFTINIIAPMLTSCRGTLSLNTDVGSCTAQADWSTSTPTAADAAGNDILPSFQSHVSNSTFSTGTTPVTYVFGNAPDTVSCTFNVVVTDNEPPSITCPSALTFNTDAGVCYTIFAGTAPSASDNCGIQSLTSSHNAGDTLYTGTTNVEYIAIDSSGNADTCYVAITVTDNEDPVITNCPSDTIIFTDAGQCEAVFNWIAPTASDNCGVTNFVPSHTSGSVFNVGMTTVTYTASDANNNTISCSFNVTVIDNELPIFSNTPPDTIASCDNIINWTPPTISDNCGTVTPTSTHNPGDVFPIGTTDVSYFAADVNGNQDTFTFKVIVHSPVNLTPSSSDISCFGANDGIATVTATNGTANFSYLWSNSATTNTINNLSTGSYDVTVTDANGCIDFATVTINEPTAIISTVTKNNNVLCNGGTNGGATASATGGAGGFSYLWDNNSIGTQVTNLDAGRHYVTITDGSGCSVVDSIDIGEPTIITATPTPITPVQCSGQSNGSASVNASGGTAPYTYLWDNNETTDTAIALNAGVHSVSVTDANNCLAVFTINIPATPPLQVTQSVVVFDVSCNGNNDGVGTFDVTGGTTPYSFVWSNSETTDTAYNLGAGAHQVTITDANGCVVGGSILISEPSVLSATLTIDSILTCNGNSNGQITATATGGTAPYNYQWNTTPLQTNATISNLGVGTYTVTVMDDNDCEFIDSVTLVEPPIITVNATFMDDSCGRGTGSISLSTNGGITPYNYTWGGTLTGETAAAIGGLNGGNYPITITDANDCVFTNSYFINDVCDSCSLFEPLTFTDNTPYIYNCLGNGEAEVIISMQGGKPEYEANNGGISNYRFSLTGASDLADGDYFDPNGIFSFKVKTDSVWTLSVNDDLGCGPVTTNGVFSETVGNCPNYCNLYPIQTMTTPADGDTIVLIDNDAPISVQVTNMDSTQNYTYSWSPSVRLSCSNCPNPIASPYESTRFDVVTQNDSGCVQIDTVLVQVAITPDSEEFVTVYSGITTNGDGNNDVLFIDGLELFPENELIVFNRWGNIVYQASPYNNDWDGKYQGKFLPEGAYYYILRTDLGNAKTLKGSILIIR